jgi:hypothetical protein
MQAHLALLAQEFLQPKDARARDLHAGFALAVTGGGAAEGLFDVVATAHSSMLMLTRDAEQGQLLELVFDVVRERGGAQRGQAVFEIVIGSGDKVGLGAGVAQNVADHREGLLPGPGLAPNPG